MIKEADALTSPQKEMARVASTLSLNTVEEEPTESLPSEPQSPGQPPAPDHSTTLNKSPQLATTKAGDKDNDRPTPVQKRNKKQKAKKEKQQKCKHGHCPERKSTDPLLRCCTCMTWHHPQCVGDAKGDGDFCGAWTCHQCRLVPAQIRQLEKTISQISRDVQTIKQVQSSHSKMQKSLDDAQLNNQQLVSHLAIKTADCQVLKGELNILQDRVELLQCTSAPDSPVLVNSYPAVHAPSPAAYWRFTAQESLFSAITRCDGSGQARVLHCYNQRCIERTETGIQAGGDSCWHQ